VTARWFEKQAVQQRLDLDPSVRFILSAVSNVRAARANLPRPPLQGQEDGEAGAFRYQVFDLDPASVGLDNPLADG